MSDSDQDTARKRAHMPEGTDAVLNTRSLHGAHKRLAELLTPGMAVLDVGCAMGAITHGIAEAVGPTGSVIGLDANEALIAEAWRLHGDTPCLAFEAGDVYHLPYKDSYDIVTAARVLQWLADPALALRQMAAAVRKGGRIVVLDYNHEKIVWSPEPPSSMRSFYSAFLRWRAEAGMDNAIADNLAALFAAAGLRNTRHTVQHEHTRRGDPDFSTRIALWAHVAHTRGHQMVADGLLSEAKRAAAEQEYRVWAETDAQSQTLYLLCVEGVR